MIRVVATLAVLMAGPVAAQEAASTGTGAVLRALDKLTGIATDLSLVSGSKVTFGRLQVFLHECRYPEGNPSGDAFAFMQISESDSAEIAFEGWMIASSPALSAMDHSRYDVWVLRCTTS